MEKGLYRKADKEIGEGKKEFKKIYAWFSSWHNSADNIADLSNILDQEHQDPPKDKNIKSTKKRVNQLRTML